MNIKIAKLINCQSHPLRHPVGLCSDCAQTVLRLRSGAATVGGGSTSAPPRPDSRRSSLGRRSKKSKKVQKDQQKVKNSKNGSHLPVQIHAGEGLNWSPPRLNVVTTNRFPSFVASCGWSRLLVLASVGSGCWSLLLVWLLVLIVGWLLVVTTALSAALCNLPATFSQL